MAPKTLFEKIWSEHVVVDDKDNPSLLFIDLHLVHEVTSPQAFEGLRISSRKVRRTDLTFATMDHNVPTNEMLFTNDHFAIKQMEKLVENCKAFGVPLADLEHKDQGIVHVIGPELGLTQPGKTIVCGDSHTSTHGAFGALAFGIGTSEVEHVLATQCLWQKKPKTLRVNIVGSRNPKIQAKDIILGLIAKYGVDLGSGHVIEYAGNVIQDMTMDERMTVCNMSVEAGARAGLIQPDDTTFTYLYERRFVPNGQEFDLWVERWKQLKSDEGAMFDKELTFDVSTLEPVVTWGTNPGMGIGVSGVVPNPETFETEEEKIAAETALDYMDLTPGTKITDIQIDYVFIGSCTNSRLEDLREAAYLVKGKKVKPGVKAIVVPGSRNVKLLAEEEGLDSIFLDAGFEWRNSGCSMCLGMNADIVPSGKRCASTSNRNFEGRQGLGARTHLVSPTMAAAAAIYGHFVDVRGLYKEVKV